MPKRNLILLFLATTICLLAWMARDRSGHGRRFGEVVSAIERSYLVPVDQRDLFEAAMEGLFSRLDEHSAFVGGDEQEELEELLDQEFGGIGLELAVEPRHGRLSVIAPVVGSPAWRAGLAPGDVVETIDGVATAGMPLREAVGRLRGRPGTAVVVGVSGAGPSASDPAVDRDRGATSVREITLVREAVKLESVLGDRRLPDGSWEWFLEGAPGIALVRITSFGDHTPADLKAAAASIVAQAHPRGFILDLRGNPGGLLSAAVEVCDLFLDEGTIVSTVGRAAADVGGGAGHRGDGATGGAADVRPATPGAVLEGVPMAVLVDGLTASAGEIVAAGLQDNGRAVVVGSRSFGKGTVQSILPLTDGDGLVKLTTAEYLRPSGATIHRRPLDADDATWGVSPDSGCEITPTRETLEAVRRWRRHRDAVHGDAATGGLGPSVALPAAVDPVLARAIVLLASRDDRPSGEVEPPADLGGEKKAARHADDAPRPRQ